MPAADFTLQRVGDGQGRQCSLALADGGDGAIDQLRVDEWTHGVMDENPARRMAPQRKQPKPDRVLPRLRRLSRR